MRERRLRFRRRMAKGRAVSPVVATLILILIAVAAAAALYLWLVGWQRSVTGTIGTPGAQATLTIGGSTSAYPFDQLAVTQFEQNYTDVVISNNQGGSGAGMDSVCAGAVDIGAASFPVTASILESTYGCSASDTNLYIITEAYDAVDVIVPSANTHGLLSINYDTLALIYEDASVAAHGTPTLKTTTVDNGSAIPTGIPKDAAGLTWNEVPGAVGGASLSLYIGGASTPTILTEALTNITTISAHGGTACGTSSGTQNDICQNQTGAADSNFATPCGFTVCAGGTNATIQTVARSDASGTTQSFEARLLDAESSSGFASASQLQSGTTGFSGCGSSNYISDCGYVATYAENGNPGVISQVAGDANAIGYASDGLARAAGSGVGLVGFVGVGQATNAYASTDPTWYGGILPTTGSSGTISLGINSQYKSTDYVTGYLGWRPFDLVMLSPPTGTAEAYLTFVLDPANNGNLATEAQEVSIYSVAPPPGGYPVP